MTSPDTARHFADDIQDSPTAWMRLGVALVLATIGGVGLWSPVVVLPVIEAEFGVDRGGASIPYTLSMVGFAAGGILMGRFADRAGISAPLTLGAVMIGVGYVLASMAQDYWAFVAAQAIVVGLLGSSATFGPLVADVSLWFRRRRGIAIAIAASGNYLAGAVWPPILEWAMGEYGWRAAHFWTGIACTGLMLPLAFLLRRRAVIEEGPPVPVRNGARSEMPISRPALQALLCLAGVACCVAMSMPQVHIVAYCGDLGYGAARGAEMLSLMLGLGIVSRIGSGMIADRIGGVGTLILGSALQCVALFLFLPFDGLVPLYVISALFGLSQGGIVPSYALIVREYFPAKEAGARVSLVITMTVLGMALGGWLTGEIHDLTGSYAIAFLHGIAWNVLNLGIALWLLFGGRPRQPRAAVA